jgi:hypothetical protein
MANTPITELDFLTVKNQLKDYLKNQDRFKDYNFEGSNMSVLLDVLAYNTFQNNYYTNMAINEMFLDSAVLENSVVSHAKELNYLPRSAKSSKAIVRISFQETSSAETILIPKNTRFSSNFGGSSYTFVSDKNYLARRTEGNTFVSEEITIYEGTVLTGFDKEGFFGGTSDTFRCVLNNDSIDTDSIEVFLNDETIQYSYAPNIFGVGPNDTVFYVEPYFDNKYAVVFGRNIFGNQPNENDDIKISYRICSASEPNGASRFSTSFRSNTIVQTIRPALGGASRETLESIKFFAPKSIQIQERAVTANDYKILLKQQFQEIESISVYGGDELEPPQFGRVAVSINLRDGEILTETTKNIYRDFIRDKSSLAIQTVFIEPEFLYGSLEVTVNFSKRFSGKTTSQIENLIRAEIQKYSKDNLNDFGTTLRVSKLTALIDSIDPGVLSNAIIAKPIIEYKPRLFAIENPAFNFGSRLIKPYPFQSERGFADYKPAVSSSVFNYQGICAIIQDDGNGNIQIVNSDISNRTVINPSIGTIDYDNGLIKLIGFSVQAFVPPAIKIKGNTASIDIKSPKNRILSIRDADVIVNITENGE